MEPTQEQMNARDLFDGGMNFVIQAGAGCGKTSTLQLLAESTHRRGAYMAFNRSISAEAARRMPGTVSASTIHSLAFRAVGKNFAHRLNAPRMRSMEIARILRLDPLIVEYGGSKKVLQPSFLGSLVMRGVRNFCYSDDKEPTSEFIPYVPGIDTVEANGRRGWSNNRIVRRHLGEAIGRAWADQQQVDGTLSFSHDSYLKIWELNEPRIPAEFVLLDEAQDTNLVTLSIFEQQTHAQRVLVGDDAQSIYGFRAANINALQLATVEAITYLSRSFRFGPAVAEVANLLLEMLDMDLRLTGTDSIESEIRSVNNPDCILTRTNAVAMRYVLRMLSDGRKVHLVGNGDQLVRFAKAVVELKETGSTYHPELACFTSFGELQSYVEQDPAGDELALMVKLCEEFSPEMIIDGLERTMPEEAADVVVSTAHSAKGREWPTVQIAEDFPEDPEDEELRLLYVAATRAQFVLDVDRCAPLQKLLYEPRLPEPPPVVLQPSG